MHTPTEFKLTRFAESDSSHFFLQVLWWVVDLQTQEILISVPWNLNFLWGFPIYLGEEKYIKKRAERRLRTWKAAQALTAFCIQCGYSIKVEMKLVDLSFAFSGRKYTRYWKSEMMQESTSYLRQYSGYFRVLAFKCTCPFPWDLIGIWTHCYMPRVVPESELFQVEPSKSKGHWAGDPTLAQERLI